MGTPIVCPYCQMKNGLLLDECRQCGQIISRSGVVPRTPTHGSLVPSAAWETVEIPKLWRQANRTIGSAIELNAHDFFRYSLMFRAMRQQFKKDDQLTWFDDCLFFLRGGYPFFCNLNLTQELTLRGRIFGGLNHAKRPARRLKDWLLRIIEEATARSIEHLDLFIAEEVNSGSSAHRITKLIKHTIDTSKHSLGMNPLSLRFVFYLACRNNAPLDRRSFQQPAKRHYKIGKITVSNEYYLFEGPIIGYDNIHYSGLRKLSKGHERIERYQSVKYMPGNFTLRCRATNELVFMVGTGDDLSKELSMMVLSLLGASIDPVYDLIGNQLKRNRCSECKDLYSMLRDDHRFLYHPVAL